MLGLWLEYTIILTFQTYNILILVNETSIMICYEIAPYWFLQFLNKTKNTIFIFFYLKEKQIKC